MPPHATHQVRLEVEVQGTAVTIVECRAPWRADVEPEWTRFPIARLRYSPAHAAVAVHAGGQVVVYGVSIPNSG